MGAYLICWEGGFSRQEAFGSAYSQADTLLQWDGEEPPS